MDMFAQEQHLIPVISFDEKIISHGKGSYIFDENGKKYLDLNAGQFCTILGHSNAEILDAVYRSMAGLAHTSTKMLSREVVNCSNAIYRISGEMKASSILLSTGAEVVEFCLRYAKFLQKKNGIVCFDKGYHGLTLGAQSVTYSGVHARPHVQDVYSIPVPTEEDTETSLSLLSGILSSNDIAAVLLEPVVSVGGMLLPPARWFQEVRSLCDQYQVLLLLDECQTGFGRTGNWFAYQTYDFVPDMVAVAKGIGLGFPVAAAMFRDILMPLDSAYPMTHYSSHQNDSFSACVINAGIEYIEKFDLLCGVQKKASYFLRQLKKLEQENPYIRNARGCGLMLGADLYFGVLKDYRKVYAELYDRMIEHGVIIQGTNGGKTLRFLPDYLITAVDIDLAIEKLNYVLLNEMKY